MLDEVSHFKPQLQGNNENIILHVQDLTCYWDKVNLLTYYVYWCCWHLKSKMQCVYVLCADTLYSVL